MLHSIVQFSTPIVQFPLPEVQFPLLYGSNIKSMKRILLIFVIVFTTTFCGQAQTTGIEVPRFKIYQTENIYTSLKLDTATGQIWQVQISLGDADPAVVEIPNNYVPTVYESDAVVPGRFELYPTKNMFNFILLDTTDGRCWQVQWSTSADKRIYLYLGR